MPTHYYYFFIFGHAKGVVQLGNYVFCQSLEFIPAPLWAVSNYMVIVLLDIWWIIHKTVQDNVGHQDIQTTQTNVDMNIFRNYVDKLVSVSVYFTVFLTENVVSCETW